MISKIIHYCWFGGNPKPELVERCMESWHRCMPDWTYMEWSESNFDIAAAPLYVRQAYEAKKYAFVSDYVRLWALEQYGGVYIDTDVEVIRAFDDERLTISGKSLLEDTAFIGFEESLAHLPGTCVMGCEAHSKWVKDMLATYKGAEFVKKQETKNEKRELRRERQEYDLTTNVQRMGKAMVEKYGLIPNGKEQVLRIEEEGKRTEEVHVYDHHYFSPITSTRVMRRNKNTYAIHHFAASWTGKKTFIGKLQDNVIVCEILNIFIQIKRLIRKYV